MQTVVEEIPFVVVPHCHYCWKNLNERQLYYQKYYNGSKGLFCSYSCATKYRMHYAGGDKVQSKALLGKKHTPEHIENNRLAQLGKTLSEEHKEKLRNNKALKDKCGKKNPAYIHGQAYRKYPPEFYAIQEKILERDKYICQHPRCESTEQLTVHHIDYNKDNNVTENLITLCNDHNLKVNHHRKLWTSFFSERTRGGLNE